MKREYLKVTPFAGRDDVELWIINNQLGRRNITAYTRSVLALKYKEIFAAKARERQGQRNDLKPAADEDNIGHNCAQSEEQERTAKKVAEVANVSANTIKRTAYIERHAPEDVKQARLA